MKTKSIIRSLLIGGVSITAGANVHAASISLNPLTSSVQVGSNFSVDLLMDFSDEATLGGGIDVNYDSHYADFVAFTFDSSFLSLSDPLMTCPGLVVCSPLDQLNSVSNIAFGNFSGIGGAYTIGTLEFTALDVGTISLVTAVTTGDAGAFVSASSYLPMEVTFNGASVSAVPLPAAAWLMLSGLGVLGVAGKTRKSC